MKALLVQIICGGLGGLLLQQPNVLIRWLGGVALCISGFVAGFEAARNKFSQQVNK